MNMLKSNLLVPSLEFSKSRFVLLLAPAVTSLKISASSRRTTSTIKVTWASITFDDASVELMNYELLYTLVRQNGNSIEPPNSKQEKLIIYSDLNAFLLTNLTSFSRYKIQMAGMFANGSRTVSNIVFGGRFQDRDKNTNRTRQSTNAVGGNPLLFQ